MILYIYFNHLIYSFFYLIFIYFLSCFLASFSVVSAAGLRTGGLSLHPFSLRPAAFFFSLLSFFRLRRSVKDIIAYAFFFSSIFRFSSTYDRKRPSISSLLKLSISKTSMSILFLIGEYASLYARELYRHSCKQGR